MAPINVSTSEQQITATVTGDNSVTATVQAGFGATGPQGPAATIAVGTVTTGAPGTSASVVNAGTSGAAVLNFTIPAGATGATGSQGPAGAKGDKGDTGDPATLPAGTEGHVLTYLDDEWVAAEPSGAFDQELNTTDDVSFSSVTASVAMAFENYDPQNPSPYVAVSDRTDGKTFFEDYCLMGVRVGSGGFIQSYDTVRIEGIGGGAAALWLGDITFAGDDSVQTTAWTGTVDAASVTGLADVATSGDYADLTGTPAAYSLPTATNSVLGGVKIGSGVTITDGVISVSTSYAAASHGHSGSDITSGTVGTARLGSGTADATTFLRGDGTWAAAGSSSASDLTSGTLSNARLTARARAAINVFNWSSFR